MQKVSVKLSCASPGITFTDEEEEEKKEGKEETTSS